MYKTLALLGLVLVIAGCAGLPTPRSQAVHHALAEDATLRELAARCGELDASLNTRASQARGDWWQRNGGVVRAADYGLLQLNWDQADLPDEDQRAYLSMQIIEMVQDDARSTVSDWLDTRRPERACERQLTAYQNGDRDLSREGDYHETLVALQNERESVSEEAEQGQSINVRYRKYGRSLFVVEQKLQTMGCARPQIATLRSEWPLEVFDAVCSDDTYVLVQCEWGRCEVRR